MHAIGNCSKGQRGTKCKFYATTQCGPTVKDKHVHACTGTAIMGPIPIF